MSSLVQKIKDLASPKQQAEMTPREIVEKLDKYIVGQNSAKRSVAIAVRNRWRRQQLDLEMRSEVAPKNILMIGSTGVGKTEIARRLAKLTDAPFIKVEATKYTEVGYYGRDVESMIRELTENAIALIRDKERSRIEDEAKSKTQDQILDKLCPPPVQFNFTPDAESEDSENEQESYARTRAKMKGMLESGDLEEREIDVHVEQKSVPIMMGNMSPDQMDVDFQGMLEKIMPKNSSIRKLPIREARKVIFDQVCEGLLDTEKINLQAVDLTENFGIIFLDEIDKVIAGDGKGADVSRQGVQRDLLPIVEGTTVQTKYGYVRTDHILFVAAGAFHKHQPSEL
ncbi:MAG: ATP-dependent protease ATPase subunit HslU, partial [Planctomycetota bacterium]